MTSRSRDFTATPATHVRYDFLKLLQKQISKHGVHYKVASIQDEFDQELPANVDGDTSTGNGPLAACGADMDGRLTMRDAILVRKGSKVKTSHPDAGHFDHTYDINLGGVLPISAPWLGVGRRQGQGHEEDEGRQVPLRQRAPRGVRRSVDPRGAGHARCSPRAVRCAPTSS